MKKTLLTVSLMLSAVAFAQAPVTAFYAPTTGENGTLNLDSYLLVNTSADLNEAALTGADVEYNFNTLTENTTSQTYVTDPADADIATYPGSTMMVHTTTATSSGGSNTTRYFFSETDNGGLSLTGVETSGFTLNYSVNNAFIGTFPLSYGFTNTDDNVAGTLLYGNYSGTFTGTGTTTVDGYGTLTVNVGDVTPKSVTRIKAQQNLTLSIMGFPGTLTQTIYSYYNEDLTTGPVFRSITNHVVVPVAGVDQSSTVYESYVATNVLSAPKNTLSKVFVAPNPIVNTLRFNGVQQIDTVTLTDATGRTVLTAAGNDINVSQLSAGIYHVTAQTENGMFTQKIVKQ